MEEMMESLLAEMKTQFGSLTARMDANHEGMMAGLKRLNATADTWLEKMEACLEKKEPTPEETEAVEKSQEVPKGETDEEMIGAAKD
jgi:hypothetical protein